MSVESRFSKAIYYSRKALGITQARAAEELDISVRWYQNIENGKCLPSARLALKIVAFYAIDGKLLRNEEAENVGISNI